MQWPSSFNYFSAGGVTVIAKVSVMVLVRFRYKDSHMILCALLYDYVLDECVCASAIALTVVPHHMIRVNVRSRHQFPLKNESDVIGKVNQNCTAVRKCLSKQRAEKLVKRILSTYKKQDFLILPVPQPL